MGRNFLLLIIGCIDLAYDQSILGLYLVSLHHICFMSTNKGQFTYWLCLYVTMAAPICCNILKVRQEFAPHVTSVELVLTKIGLSNNKPTSLLPSRSSAQHQYKACTPSELNLAKLCYLNYENSISRNICHSLT